MTAPNEILVGIADHTVWVRVEGRGSFQNSPGLKEFSRQMLDRGRRDFVIDLGGCPVMDSTFMGTLAGIALKLREAGGGSIRVVRANERNHDLLANLGLDRLLDVNTSQAETPQTATSRPLNQHPADKQTQAETMIEAHEALVEAAPDNLPKFKDVLEFLRQDAQDSGR